MRNIAEVWIRDLEEDSLVLKLLKEIEEVTHYHLTPHQNNGPVIHYLIDYRKLRPITKDSLDSIPFSNDWLLMKPIKKLHDTDIYWLCQNIAKISHTGVEKIAGMKLYAFLDQYLKDGKRKKKRVSASLPGYPLV